jgi:HD-like signal output (HDOD) protein
VHLKPGIVRRELSTRRQIRQDSVATIIKSDLGATTYLLQVANSPLYAGAAPVRQVEQAIARLGINSTRHLVMAHAVGAKAGAVQDIGVLPILNVLNRYHEQLSNEAHVLNSIDKFAPPVGTILLTRWGFEADMIEVARSRGNWLRDAQPAADLADLVLVARLHANITSGDQAQLAPRVDAVPAFGKLPLGNLQPDGSITLLHDEEASINALMSLLGTDR